MGVRLGVRVGLVVGWWYHCCDRLARRLAHLKSKVYFPCDDDDIASRDHLAGASCAPVVGVASGGYGTGGGGGRGCSFRVNGCRGDGGGFSALYVNSERKGRIVEVETYVLECLMEL